MPRKLSFEKGKVFKVVDREKVDEELDESLFDYGMKWEDWGENGIPEYIIIRHKASKIDISDDDYDDDQMLDEEEQQEIRPYKTYDVHPNKNVTNCTWSEFRIEYLLENGLLEEAGFYTHINKLDDYFTENQSSWEISLAEADEVPNVEDSLNE